MSLLDGIRGHGATVGLDIGSHSLKLVKLNRRRDGYYLEATGLRELEPGTIEGGDIKKRDALIDAITTLVNQCDPSIVEVVMSMSGHGILSDRLTFTIDPNENTEEMILWEAGQRSPFDVDDITLDYKILTRRSDSNEIDVLLVAAKNQVMQDYVDLLYDAGLKPTIVDVDAFAVHNCYSVEMGEEAPEGNVLLLNIGHELTTTVFMNDGVYHSTRDIATAGAFFSKTLRRNLGISAESAQDILKGQSDPSLDMNAVNQSIEYAVDELSSGINLAFSYYKSSGGGYKIDKIVISGGGSYIPELDTLLADRHETTVVRSNPLSAIKFDPGLFGGTDPQRISAFLTVAVGLGMRKIGTQ